MINFGYPLLFWFMSLPLVVFAFLIMTNKSSFERIFSNDIISKLRVTSATMPHKLRQAIFFLALFLMVLAMSRPFIPNEHQDIKAHGISVAIALDISGSMRSEDIYPNRLTFAKQKILDILDELETDEVALAAFSNQAFVIAPLSYDKATLSDMVQRLDVDRVPQNSTNFHTLPLIGEHLLSLRSPKILLVVTDGEDDRGLKDLASKLKKSNIILFSLVVGTTEGAVVLDRFSRPLLLADGSVATTKRNDEIINISKATKGDGIVATYSKSDIKFLAQKMRNFADDKKELKFSRAKELFYYPLGLALILLLVSLSSLPRKGRR